MVTLFLKRPTNSFNYLLYSICFLIDYNTQLHHKSPARTLKKSNRRYTIIFDRKSSRIAKLVLLIGILLLLGISKNLYKFAPTLKHLILFKNDRKMDEKHIVCLTIMFNFLSSASIIV